MVYQLRKSRGFSNRLGSYWCPFPDCLSNSPGLNMSAPYVCYWFGPSRAPRLELLFSSDDNPSRTCYKSGDVAVAPFRKGTDAPCGGGQVHYLVCCCIITRVAAQRLQRKG